MEQRIEKEKIKASRKLILVVVFLLIVIFFVTGFIFFKVADYITGTSEKEKFVKYDKKIYTFISQDGKIDGLIGTKMVSCGEFPSDVCLNVYYNFFVKDELPAGKYEASFNMIGDRGKLQPILCDANISKIDPFKYNSGYPCDNAELVKANQNIFFDSTSDVIRSGDALENFPNLKTIKIYDVSSGDRKIVREYIVIVQ